MSNHPECQPLKKIWNTRGSLVDEFFLNERFLPPFRSDLCRLRQRRRLNRRNPSLPEWFVCKKLISKSFVAAALPRIQVVASHRFLTSPVRKGTFLHYESILLGELKSVVVTTIPRGLLFRPARRIGGRGVTRRIREYSHASRCKSRARWQMLSAVFLNGSAQTVPLE